MEEDCGSEGVAHLIHISPEQASPHNTVSYDMSDLANPDGVSAVLEEDGQNTPHQRLVAYMVIQAKSCY